MKINTFYPGADGVDNKKRTSAPADSSAANFAELLDRQVEGQESAAQPSGITGISSMPDVRGFTAEQTAAISRGEAALDILEHLGAILQQNEPGQGSIDSLGEILQEQVEMIRDRRDSLDASDPLRKTMNEIGIMAAVQGSKIDRGDYS